MNHNLISINFLRLFLILIYFFKRSKTINIFANPLIAERNPANVKVEVGFEVLCHSWRRLWVPKLNAMGNAPGRKRSSENYSLR